MTKWEHFTKAEILKFVQESKSYASFVQKMGYSGQGGNTKIVCNKIKEKYPDISYEHFTGQAWNKGMTSKTEPRIGNHEKYTLEEIFCKESKVTQKVMRGYVERHELLPYRCAKCGCDGNWQNGKISLEIHHINGDNTDNRIENLQYLCPNCHALTDNYRGLNKKKE